MKITFHSTFMHPNKDIIHYRPRCVGYQEATVCNFSPQNPRISAEYMRNIDLELLPGACCCTTRCSRSSVGPQISFHIFLFFFLFFFLETRFDSPLFPPVEWTWHPSAEASTRKKLCHPLASQCPRHVGRGGTTIYLLSFILYIIICT